MGIDEPNLRSITVRDSFLKLIARFAMLIFAKGTIRYVAGEHLDINESLENQDPKAVRHLKSTVCTNVYREHLSFLVDRYVLPSVFHF